jgi:putative Mn2+ efflux pump MntP
MTILETILLSSGMSMEIFAWVVCKSSDYSRIDKRKIVLFTLAFGIWEAIALLAGYYGVFLLKQTGLSDNAANMMRLITIIFFIVFACELLYKGIKNDQISEKRSDEISFSTLMKSVGRISLHTLLEGIGLSFCDTPFLSEFLTPLIASLLATVCALWAGYHYGFEVKTRAYIIGFILILIAITEMVFRFIP